MKHNKLVSWWFRPYHGWKPLDEKTKDLYRRRADSFAENGNPLGFPASGTGEYHQAQTHDSLIERILS